MTGEVDLSSKRLRQFYRSEFMTAKFTPGLVKLITPKGLASFLFMEYRGGFIVVCYGWLGSLPRITRI
ncbi:hypothetical protein BDV32DRAFT_117234 [Aspergillus pseudonomiae]|nr:hypothetical protein BDV32DRAFT_117234 [Aspergillus pseudonomiae]